MPNPFTRDVLLQDVRKKVIALSEGMYYYGTLLEPAQENTNFSVILADAQFISFLDDYRDSENSEIRRLFEFAMTDKPNGLELSQAIVTRLYLSHVSKILTVKV